MYIRLSAALLSLVGILIATLTASIWIVLLCEGLLLSLCIVDAILAPSTARITYERRGSDTARVNEEIHHELVLTNTAKRHIEGSFRDAWPPSVSLRPARFSFHLNAGEKIALQQTFTSRRRGTRQSEHITIRSAGPLHLAGRQHSYPTNWDVRVLPPFISRKHLPSRIQRLRELEGRALLLTRGEGTEFDSLREYVAGDDVRAIDWRSTARLGTTVVRTWRPERDRRVIIVVDAGRSGALRIGDAPAFDTYIETSLLTAALCTRAGDRVHVIALNSHLCAQVSAHKGISIINKLAEAYADIEPNLDATSWPLATAAINRLTHQPSLVILLTTLGLTSISDGLLDTVKELARRHTVLIGTVERAGTNLLPHPTVEEAYCEAADARAMLELYDVTAAMERAGSMVVQKNAQDLPPAIADAYVELKARGKL